MLERLIFTIAICVFALVAYFQYRMVEAQSIVMSTRAEVFQETIKMTDQKLRMMRAARDILVLAFFDADKERPDLEKAIAELPYSPVFEELAKAVVAFREKLPGGTKQRVLKALETLDKEIGL